MIELISLKPERKVALKILLTEILQESSREGP